MLPHKHAAVVRSRPPAACRWPIQQAQRGDVRTQRLNRLGRHGYGKARVEWAASINKLLATHGCCGQTTAYHTSHPTEPYCPHRAPAHCCARTGSDGRACPPATALGSVNCGSGMAWPGPARRSSGWPSPNLQTRVQAGAAGWVCGKVAGTACRVAFCCSRAHAGVGSPIAALCCPAAQPGRTSGRKAR